MLDTNICIYVINNRPEHVRAKFEAHQVGQIAVSVITAAELAHGVKKSARVDNRLRMDRFLSPLRVLPWTQELIWTYADEKARLFAAGNRIGDMDLLIACHARHLNLTLVTNNTREFERIDGLKLENWVS